MGAEEEEEEKKGGERGNELMGLPVTIALMIPKDLKIN